MTRNEFLALFAQLKILCRDMSQVEFEAHRNRFLDKLKRDNAEEDVIAFAEKIMGGISPVKVAK